MRRICLAWVVPALVAACSAPADGPPQRRRSAPDKARLYGDPVLVPSRDGEAARRELALAGEITASLAAGETLDELHVDVELDRDGPARVVVGGRWRAGVAADRVPIAEIVAAIVGDEHTLVLAIAELPAPEPMRGPIPLGLVLAAVGLGASLGITLDRAARRRRRARTRR